MKKTIIITAVSAVAIVSLFLLAVSINENKAEGEALSSVPKIKAFESRSAEWGKHFPRQYETYMGTKKDDHFVDLLDKYPALVVMWAGYGFSKDYNSPRGHFYMVEDNVNTLRTGGPVDDKTGPMPTACWTCKSSDVPRLMEEHGELDYFTGKWPRWGSEVVNPVGCLDCHSNETMELTLTRPYLVRALDKEGSLPYKDVTHQDMRSLTCAQCHSEYYFKKTEWTDDDGTKKVANVVTFPWDNGTSVEEMEKYYDDRNFVDWTHKVSRAPMLKAQHPDYELYKTGAHARNNVSCADCHLPTMREGTTKFSSHNTGNPLDNMQHSCLVCHRGTEEELRATVGRKLERKDELHYKAMQVLAKAHIEAGKAWELGATEEEMAAALQDIRHGQWRWDYVVASHGGFFHAPGESLRILGSAIEKGQEARLKLRIVLARYGAAEFVAADFSTKEKAQEIIGLPYDKLVEEKDHFLNTLRQEWIKDATEKGLFDPATREGMDNI